MRCWRLRCQICLKRNRSRLTKTRCLNETIHKEMSQLKYIYEILRNSTILLCVWPIDCYIPDFKGFLRDFQLVTTVKGDFYFFFCLHHALCFLGNEKELGEQFWQDGRAFSSREVQQRIKAASSLEGPKPLWHRHNIYHASNFCS